MIQPPEAILCLSGDPWGEPRGGQKAFAKQMLTALRDRVAVVSTCDDDLPVGQWQMRPFDGCMIHYFNLGTLRAPTSRKPLVPARISLYKYAYSHMQKIHASGIRSIFCDGPEFLFAASRYGWENVCYCFAGVHNPIATSRYWFLRPLGSLFERRLVAVLHQMRPNAILAAADQRAIGTMKRRLSGALDDFLIHSFPTRVDLTRFYPEAKLSARSQTGLPPASTILVATGRLCWIKGWELLLGALSLLNATVKTVELVFVGDGEDRSRLLETARQLGVEASVRVTGFLPPDSVRTYLNAADVYVVGSYNEGWSLAMLEALACGKPVVSTDVSGAAELIHEGSNGYIVKDRDPITFARAVESALSLSRAGSVSTQVARRFSVTRLAGDLAAVWPVFSQVPQ